MVGEIGRCTTQFLSVGQHVPQDFAESYNIGSPAPLPLLMMEGSSYIVLFHIHRFILRY